MLRNDRRLGVAVVEQPHAGLSAPINLDDAVDAAMDTLADEIRDWPLHWFWLELTDESIVIEASRLPTVPVFVADDGAQAYASWDPAALYPILRPSLDLDRAAVFLCEFDQPYEWRTVIAGCHRIAARHKATWRPRVGWHVVMPAPEPQPYPRVLVPEADPVARLGELIDAAIGRHAPDRSTPVATALSGGLDSSCVALVAARRRHPISAHGLVLPGATARWQRERQQAVAAAMGCKPALVAADTQPAWTSRHGRLGRGNAVPWEELLYDLHDRLLVDATATGADVMLSGFGGDELLAPYWAEVAAEQPPAEPEPPLPPIFPAAVLRQRAERRAAAEAAQCPAFVQESVMSAVAASAAPALRRGLWPIHPLATPEVAAYAHALPAAWRADRRVMRALLERLGADRCVTEPGHRESFTDLCEAPLREAAPGDALLSAPHLADLGLVEPRAIAAALELWRAGRVTGDWGPVFIAVALLEGILAALSRPASMASANCRLAVV